METGGGFSLKEVGGSVAKGETVGCSEVGVVGGPADVLKPGGGCPWVDERSAGVKSL